MHRVRDLEIDSDREFDRRNHRVQKAAWVGMMLFVLAGLAGLLGHGPLSQARVRATGLEVRYHRFERFQTPSSITILDPQGTAVPRPMALWLDAT
ncbi:MAG TPA: hypothetical protein VIE39_08400, partial [Thermoanaerobaculia bacterium]